MSLWRYFVFCAGGGFALMLMNHHLGFSFSRLEVWLLTLCIVAMAATVAVKDD